MARRLVDITLDNLNDLPGSCRTCVFWELDAAVPRDAADPAIEKEAWVSDTLLQWGSCGKLAYIDGVPAGYMLYAPAAYVPRATAFPTAPVSPDAVLLMSGRVNQEYAGKGVGGALAQSVARDVAQRGIKAMEAFGHTGVAHPDSVRCILPAGYLRAVGFKTVRAHPHMPRLRLETRALAAWRSEIEAVVDRLLTTSSVRVH
jgi:GNAT superfamily N-acetyltransferase